MECRSIKIEASFNDIADNIRLVCQKKTTSKTPMEAFDVLKISEEKICWLFKSEIGDVLDHFSSCPLEWQWNQPLPAISLVRELLEYTGQILECIREECLDNPCVSADQKQKVSEFSDRVAAVRSFLNSIKPVFPDYDMMINNFLTHLASVAVRTANQSIFYWISKKLDPNFKLVRLLELQQEIDPVSPQFLELILKLFRAPHRVSPDHSVYAIAQFIFQPSCYKYYSFKKDVENLILFIINESEETPNHSLVAEIKLMLTLVVYYARDLLHHLSYHELDRSICLLTAEILLKQQLNCTSTISLGNQVEELNKILTYLQEFSELQELAGEVASIYQSFNQKNIPEHVVRTSLFKLLLKTLLLKADASFTELLKLLDGNESMIGTVKDGIETSIKGLNFFMAFVINQPKETTSENMELIFKHIEASTRGMITLSYSLHLEKITEEVIETLILSFSDLLDKMTVELRKLYLTFPSYSFPKIVGMGFIDFLLENLRELLKYNPDSIALVKDHIERIQLALEVSRSFLIKLDTDHLELVDLATRVTDVAYEAEYVIDSIEVGNGDFLLHFLRLHDVIAKIRLINMQATNICEEKSCDAKDHNVTEISSQTISLANKPEIGDIVMCISEDEDIVIDRLTRGSNQLDIISIVGIPGIGKTTLAKKVYNDPKVTVHFHVRAWCSVSQVYAIRELLLDILCDITSGIDEHIHQMTDEDLELRLYRCLKQRRYLIVLDDVWDTTAWNALEKSFPNDGNGSRILMTSRLRDVSLKAKPYSEPHSLRLLSDDESWKLLQMKIFQGSCPDELLEAGKQIAKACKGLPLAIVAIAGLLEKTEKKQDGWKRIAESVSSHIIDDPQTRCMEILQLSYNRLPDYLKSCYLYFGAFFEDKDVPVCKLIRLWIAEGFIQKSALKSCEDVAEEYLIDLISRSLVTISKKGSRGRVKACRIHDLLREMCLSKAKEVNFFQLVSAGDEPYTSFSELDCGGDFYDYYPSNPVIYEMRRLSFCLKRKHFVKSCPSGPCTRSLMFFAISDAYPRCPYDISFIPDHFKLLWVLDLEEINAGVSFPTGIELLVYLRYLAICGDLDFIPQSIANLHKLETLIVKGLKGKVMLPSSIWSMARLRHIHVNHHAVFNLQDDKLGDSLHLQNLVSISTPLLTYGKETEKILMGFPNLRKLRCVLFESLNPSEKNYNQFPELHFLTQLESLKMFYFGRVLNTVDFSLPMNLKKLTLSNFRLPWTLISAVGRLENLEVLKLLSRAFEGKRWDMKEGEFLKLKYLKLDTLNIDHWNASNDHLPNLQQLVLRNCDTLEEVPSSFAEIPTLLKIVVQSCGRSTEESVRNIGEQEIEGLEIIINQKINI